MLWFVRTAARTRRSIECAALTGSTASRKRWMRCSAYLFFELDLKRLGHQSRFEEIRHPASKFAEMEEKRLRAQIGRRAAHRRRDVSHNFQKNQIGGANWWKTDKKVGSLSQQSLKLQGLQRLVRQVLPTIRRQTCGRVCGRSGRFLVHLFAPHLILIHLCSQGHSLLMCHFEGNHLRVSLADLFSTIGRISLWDF
jgi:hypothetical protein